MSVLQNEIPSSVIEAAVDWMVRLEAGDVDEALQLQFHQWLEADPGHRTAWNEISQSLTGFQQMQSLGYQHAGHASAVYQAISNKKISTQRRKFLRGGMAVVVLGAGTGYLVNRVTPLAHFNADYVTGTGERHSMMLADGTQVRLNARSALDVDFTHTQRVLRLHSGECLLEVASDAVRPLLLQTPHGVVHVVSGSHLLALVAAQQSVVMVQQQAVKLVNTEQQTLTLGHDEAAWFDAAHVQRKVSDFMARSAWIHGMLDVRNQSLAEVVESLRAYHHGWIRVSPRAASLRVFGMFRLDDVGQALYSLQAVLPITIKRYGNVLTMIDLL
ncbi:DUF4880 domain-containing protein [Methylobacillus gramineus]|uniref:FecR family protein n=1 Tax=Methylobacillus gramineus TaxID=755169 RepID=UPI001CFF8547|nr:FecR domain-containing protein [Methylobacillus gramineus]MCB5185757.1 DUF4880 domain-containing protein [Methylobacillus gramineus]